MFTDSEERVLMERTAAGDRSAFRSLFNVYYPVVHGFMRSILQTKEDASDVAQEVFTSSGLCVQLFRTSHRCDSTFIG